MVQVKVVLLLSLAVVAGGFGGLAAETGGLSGTVGAEAAFLPGFSTDVWLDLDWNVGGFNIGSLTEVTVLPGFNVGETLAVDHSLGPVDLGGTVMIDVYPFAFGGLDFYAGVGLFDVAQGVLAISADATLLSEVYPALNATLSLDVDASYGILSLWADFDLGIPGFGASVLIGGEIRAFDLDLDNGGLTADLGVSAFVVPAVDAWFWFDMALELGAVTVTAQTDFNLTPFGLTEQRFEVEVGFDGLSVYAWGSFTGAGDLSAGIGGTYDFP